MGCIEGHVSLIPEGEDILFFSSSDGGPVVDGSLGGMTSELMVSYHSSQHSVINGINSGFLADLKGCHRAYEDLEFLVLSYLRSKLIVKGMDSLDNYDLAPFDGSDPLAKLLVSRQEVEGRKINFFSFKEADDVSVEEIDIHSIQVLEVVLAVFIKRSFFPFDEIVVGTHVERVQAENLELCAEFLGSGGLAGA